MKFLKKIIRRNTAAAEVPPEEWESQTHIVLPNLDHQYREQESSQHLVLKINRYSVRWDGELKEFQVLLFSIPALSPPQVLLLKGLCMCSLMDSLTLRYIVQAAVRKAPETYGDKLNYLASRGDLEGQLWLGRSVVRCHYSFVEPSPQTQ